jgi:hypothetical protein
VNISSLESSFFKLLYETFEVPFGIKIFESVYYVDFTTYDNWIVIDSLSHTTGSVPKAQFFLHLSIKNGLMNDKVVLNALIDKVTAAINQGFRFNCYDSVTALLIGEAEIADTNLAPALLHMGGGSFRSLSVEIVYAGTVPVG